MDQRSRGQPQTVITNHKPSRGQGSRQNSHIPQSRMQFPQGLRPERRQNGRISMIEVHHLKCLEGNCMRNFSPADERWPQGLPTRIRTLTVRAFSGSPAALPRKNSPSTGLSVAHPRKNSPSTPENSIFRPFWACRANFFALTPIPGRAGRAFSRIARDDGTTLKPTTPLHATLRAPLKPPTPLQGRNRAKMAFRRSQMRWRFHSAARKC